MIRNGKKVILVDKVALLIPINFISTLWMVLCLITSGVTGQAGSQRPVFNVLNPEASLGGQNGFGGEFIGATGSYAGTSRSYPGGSGMGGGTMGGGPNLGTAVAPTTVVRYLDGVQSLRAMPVIPARPSNLTAGQMQQFASLYNKLSDMEAAQNEMLAFFGRTYISLNAALDKLAYVLQRPRPSYGSNPPVVTAFGLTGIGTQANGGGIDPAMARKTLLQLSNTTNLTLYNMQGKPEGQRELKKYQDTLSDIIAAPVPPVGINLDDARAQFARVQKAIAQDPLMSTYGTSYDLPAAAATAANANYDKLLAITNRWNVGQSALEKLNILNTAAGDRRTLVYALTQSVLPPFVNTQVKLAISQIDAAQLTALNKEVEATDFEKQLSAFKKALVFKAQNIKGASLIKTIDVAWFVEKIAAYNDLISKISKRADLKDADIDLVQGLVAVTERSKENLAKLQKYKDIFAKVVSTPVKRINLGLQADVEKVFGVLSALINTPNILKDSKFSIYESTLKQVLASPQDMPDSLTIMQVRKMYKDMQKVKGVVLFQQLRAYQQKVNDLAAAKVIPIGQGKSAADVALAGDDKEDFIDETAEAKKAVAAAGKVLADAKKNNQPEVVKNAQSRLAKAQEDLKALISADAARAAVAAANAVDKGKNAGHTKVDVELKKKMDGLAGIMEVMDQLSQSLLNGVFANSATFGNIDVSEDQAMSLIAKVNKALVDVEYKDAVALNNNMASEAQAAVNRLQDMLEIMQKEEGKVLSPKIIAADLKRIKLSLIYDVVMDTAQGTRKSLVARINAILLEQLMNGDFADLEKKFDEKIQNTLAALSALDTLEQLVVTEDTQGAGRQRAKDLIDRIATFLDKK